MLSPGARFGPYEIVAPIGAGGMGEVYRASDTRLHRTVAIKVMSERLRDRPDLRARFRIEAEAIAAINHPHICQLYDIGQHDEVDFLVMEHVEGETLAARLARGRLPLDRALTAAREIADALDAAHRQGIVHRDLKPGNVMLTRTGVKLLDFGVARLRVRMMTAVAADATLPPNDSRLTDSGSALGTWRYMAPEQIRGEEADGRSDLFALGAVIYEMLTARPAFDGASHHALVTAILESDPPPMPGPIPPGLEQIVRTCLAKQPDDRWQSAGDLRRALDTITAHIASAAHPASRSSPRWLGWALAAVTLAGLALVGVLRVRATAPVDATQVVRSVIQFAPETVVTGSGAVAFSPDGASIIYKAMDNGTQGLYRRPLSETASVEIAGTERASGPFLSPDGQWVAFFRAKQLMKVPIGGGRPVVVAEIESFAGGSWGADGVIVVGTRHESGLFRVPATGGTLEPLTVPTPDDQGNDHRYPQVLPGGRGVLFSVGTGPEESARIEVLDLRSGARKELLRGSASARYVSTGHLVYARNAELFAVSFDLERLDVSGAQARIAEGVAEGTDGAPEYSFSRAGDLIYVPGVSGGERRALAFVDMRGVVDLAALAPGYYVWPRVSPDGRRIALGVGGAKNNIWVYDISRQTSTRVTFGRYHSPVWTPDGRLTAAQGPPGRLRLIQRAADPGGTDDEIIAAGPIQYPKTWTPDGQTLLYERDRQDGQWDLWAVSPGRQGPRPLVASRFNELNPRVSPDGRWLAYVSDEGGRDEVYVRALEGDGPRVQVSVEGAAACAWAPDGHRLYYRGPDGVRGASMWSVDLVTGPALSASPPRRLFANPGFLPDFDITPDGKRFVMVQQDTTPPPRQLHLVQNGFSKMTSSNPR